MAGPTDQQPPDAGSTPVPDLIERYRLRRDAWIAQADELARLRDEVRGSAEREAMEIVTAARRDVRKVIMEARRELLVLSAQVQAALGEATHKTDPAALLNKAGIIPEPGEHAALGGATDVFAPEDAVNEILNEVHQDMTALAEDARALPLQVVPPLRQIAAPSRETEPLPQPSFAPPITSPLPRIPAPPADVTHIFSSLQESIEFSSLQESIETPDLSEVRLSDGADFSESASKTLLSSPFPSDAVPVQSGKRISTFVAAFVGVGVVVVGVTIWWLSSRGSTTEAANVATASPGGRTPASPATAPVQPGPADQASTAPSADSPNLTVVAEAVRNVWVRTTVDGQTDDGRTLVAGQSIDVSADQSISMRVGDGGAILVSVNNGEKRPLGRDGQVVTRNFVVEKPEAPEPVPAPAPAKPTPAPPANTRTTPPIASAAPAAAVPIPPPSTTAVIPPPNPPSSNAPAPVIPPSSVNQLVANGPQPSVPAAVNQLSSAPPSSASAAVSNPSSATVVVAIARQWLEAYHRQDRSAMAALSTENLLLADERRADERFPPGLTDVTRTLDRVSVQIAADTAVLTAVMMEQSGSTPSPHVSPISQVWVLGGGQWKVRQARFVSQARLNQVFK